MKLTFLGSSHGVPEPRRKCSCTMIETNGRYYLVDVGTAPIDELAVRGIPVDAVKGIFVTHMHGDHTNGLIPFLDLISWKFKTAEPTVYLPNAQARTAIEGWLSVNGVTLRDIPILQVEPGVIFNDGFLKVTAIPTQHIQASYAYLVEADGKSVLFTGDLKHPSVDFPAVEKKTNLYICEAAHFDPIVYKPIFEAADVERICFNHYVNRNIGSIMTLAADNALPPISLATDGFEINL